MIELVEALEAALLEIDENASLVGVLSEETRVDALMDLAALVNAARPIVRELLDVRVG